ncbi:N-acetylglucosamine-specific PTS transporter subunit IIBC [Sphingosinicella sp. LHD-64]|uniref:N-acetylglucosamine-specific PTS transporter subunit IIBC n=1 Tax=Sphingosinicella sp. LHD-64 TaxID=3072139 RepID=UPI0028103B48|nr:N-acetylglucosamine-specific PTS transporter subunit IIBC [Sphingosinicella sp. LHD-64]MDQ8756929.1 N-acetylglucosamine-specific PTS transporter subunit IIBC [Sphingosinicella sp. LHD-64]
MKLGLDRLQPLGRALMLPIAVLPVAGLLLRLGQPDLLNIAFIAAAGSAIFSNLGLLFAIGVAVGVARENHGAAGLAGAVGYLVTIEGAKTLLVVPPEVTAAYAEQAGKDLASAAFAARELAKLSVPAGILAGLTAGWLYNRYANIKLPEYLAFFGGRRFVPIAAGFAGIVGAIAFGLGFPWLEQGIDTLSRWVVSSGPIGLFIYGALNRLLIVTGLHHILNNIAWFIVGDYGGATGDLQRFFAGDPDAGGFMSGFFPVMMFGLPAACFAMYRSALPERRKAVGGMLLSLALTSFLTGVTEPIEFTFMFLAPLLYAVHAVLTGLSMALMDALGIRLGFSFSAGLFDYVINFGSSTRPLLLLPVGTAYFAVYYAVFRFCILRFDLKTPGRDVAPAQAATPQDDRGRADAMIAALGGRANLLTVDACTTRLRLTLADPALADEARLKALGARGLVSPGGNALQVVLGPQADQVATEIRDALAGPAAAPLSALLDVLGGAGNVRALQARSGRLRVRVNSAEKIDPDRVKALGVRGFAVVSPTGIHVLAGDQAGIWSEEYARATGS